MPGDAACRRVSLILTENIGYLIDDAHRADLLREFGQRVGFDAASIARAPREVLFDIARRGVACSQTLASNAGGG